MIDWAWTPFVSHQDRSLPKKHPIKENHANEWSLQASENANSYGIINHVEVAVWLKLFSDLWHNIPWHRLWEVPNFSRDKSACKIIPPLKSSQSRRRQLFSTPLKLCVLHVAHTGVFKTWNSNFFPYQRKRQNKLSGHPRIWPNKTYFWPDIVHWPGVICSPEHATTVFLDSQPFHLSYKW